MPSILQGGGKPKPAMPAEHQASEPMPQAGGGGEQRSTLVSHGDGTHHIEHEDGNRTDHEHIGHALMHLAGKHSEGMHHHVHHDGMGGGHTVHTAAHGGEPEGPHDHENLESVKDGLNEFFNEEQNESDWSDKGDKTQGKDGGKDYE